MPPPCFSESALSHPLRSYNKHVLDRAAKQNQRPSRQKYVMLSAKVSLLESGGPRGRYLKGGHLKMGFRTEARTRHVNLIILHWSF